MRMFQNLLLLCLPHLATFNLFSETLVKTEATQSSDPGNYEFREQLSSMIADYLNTQRGMFSTQEKFTLSLATDNSVDDTTHEDVGGRETNVSLTVQASDDRTPLKELEIKRNFFPTAAAHHTTGNLGSIPARDRKTLPNIETVLNQDTDTGLRNNMEGVSPSGIWPVTNTVDLMTGAERTTVKLQYPRNHFKVSSLLNGLWLHSTVKDPNKEKDPDSSTDPLLRHSIVTHPNQDSLESSQHPQPRLQLKDTFLDIFSDRHVTKGMEGTSQKPLSRHILNAHTQNQKPLAGVSEENRQAESMTLPLKAEIAVGILSPQSTVPNCKDGNGTFLTLQSSRLICLIVLWALGVAAAVFFGLTVFLWVSLSVQKEGGRRGRGRLRQTAKGAERQSLWATQKSSVEQRVEFWYTNGTTMEFDNRGKDNEKGRKKERGRGGEGDEFWVQPKVTLDEIAEFWYLKGRELPETQV